MEYSRDNGNSWTEYSASDVLSAPVDGVCDITNFKIENPIFPETVNSNGDSYEYISNPISYKLTIKDDYT